METILLIVTAVSLLVALAMSYTAWRLGREQRQRTEARVAALSAEAGVTAAEPPASFEEPVQPAARVVQPARAPWSPSPLTEPLFDDRLNVEPDSGRPILAAEQPESNRGPQRRLAAAAAVLFVVLAGGMFWLMFDRAPTMTPAAQTAASPLELVSLRHERRAAKLAVSGLVRNPVSGQAVNHLSAVVLLFDQQGTFVTSAKALVDFVLLGNGDESPFVVILDAPASVTRYRVSFRTEAGAVAHVDRRGASPIAQGEQAVSLKVK